ncbi:MAG: glycosyltransferase family 4 protein, partial [Nevskiales bacterium]|nr:glycosyltransferase family 4 protein [Nevskiales bacterium]
MSAVIFLNRYFFPDHSSTGQMLSDLAFDLARAGHAVHVITGRQIYDDAEATLVAREAIQGVRVHRVWTTRFGRQGLLGRAVDYLSFYVSAVVCLARTVRRGDRVVVMTDPPLISIPVAVVARLRGAWLIHWLQDLFPEIACRLRLKAVAPVAPLLRVLRNASLRAAHLNVVLGERMARRVADEGIPPDRIRIIHNWSDGSQIRPVAPADNALRAAWGLQDRFVAGYSGNMGRVHEFDTILAAMQELVGDERIVFLFI